MQFRRFALLPLALAVACGATKKPAEDPSSTPAADGAPHEGPAQVGKAAPDLSIQSLNAKGDVKLGDLGGKVVVVDFWATWCGPCKQSFPGLQALSKRHEGKVAVVGVSVNDEQEGITDFAKELGTTFPIGWDKGHTIADRWKVATMPSSYVVDGAGTVRYVHAGYHEGDEVEIEKEVAALIGDAANAPAAAKKAEPEPVAAAAPAGDPEPKAEDAPKTTPPPRTRAKKTTKKKATKKKATKRTPDV
jgi:cytochrome c biogenesis protein CcmG, thiol:disulfide interchange protein DsbE